MYKIYLHMLSTFISNKSEVTVSSLDLLGMLSLFESIIAFSEAPNRNWLLPFVCNRKPFQPPMSSFSSARTSYNPCPAFKGTKPQPSLFPK